MPQAPYHAVPAEVMSAFARREAAAGLQAEMELEAVGDPGSGSNAVDAWSALLGLVWFLETHTVLQYGAGSALHWLFAEGCVAARMQFVALPAVEIQLVLVGEGPAELGQLEGLPAKGLSPLVSAVIVLLTR